MRNRLINDHLQLLSTFAIIYIWIPLYYNNYKIPKMPGINTCTDAMQLIWGLSDKAVFWMKQQKYVWRTSAVTKWIFGSTLPHKSKHAQLAVMALMLAVCQAFFFAFCKRVLQQKSITCWEGKLQNIDLRPCQHAGLNRGLTKSPLAVNKEDSNMISKEGLCNCRSWWIFTFYLNIKPPYTTTRLN